MSRQNTGSRKKSIHASQYRVGRYGCTDDAASRVIRTSDVISTASAPNPAPSDELVSVDRNSAIAATPSIDTVMKATVPSTRNPSCTGVIGAPDSEVTPPGSPTAWGGALPSRIVPAR